MIIIMKHHGCVMAQVVGHQSFITKTQFRYQASPCKIYGERRGTETGFSLNTSVFTSEYHSSNVPHIQLSYHQCTILAMESTVKNTINNYAKHKYGIRFTVLGMW